MEREGHDQAAARENNRRMAAAYADAAEARLAREAEDRLLDEAAFAELMRVMRGEISPPLDLRSAKTLRLLLSHDSDTTITQQAFHAHPGRTERRPHSYFRRTAPALVAALMRATRVALI